VGLVEVVIEHAAEYRKGWLSRKVKTKPEKMLKLSRDRSVLYSGKLSRKGLKGMKDGGMGNSNG
jgi:hypothetical protein